MEFAWATAVEMETLMLVEDVIAIKEEIDQHVPVMAHGATLPDRWSRWQAIDHLTTTIALNVSILPFNLEFTNIAGTIHSLRFLYKLLSEVL